MTKRTLDWNEDLAERLQNLEFAKEFILACLEEDLSLQDAIAKFIRSYGVVEYSKVVNMPKSNLLRAIRKNSNPTLNTLKKIIEPLGLDVGIILKKAS